MPATNEQPLLRTKIAVPRIFPEYVHRPRLTEQIRRGVMGPLTLLFAPAGYGKTSLLIEWAKESTLPVAWLTLDREDNDPIRFFCYLISALQVVEPRLGEEGLEFIQSSKSSGPKPGISLLINEISTLPKEIALVLDEFQVLEEPAIYSNFNFLLEHLPDNLHLLIASRGEPRLDLVNLRAKRRLVSLGAADLRFTEAEVALFCKQSMGLELPREIVQTLEERTDGWITALQMAAISLRHQPDPAELIANLQGEAHYLVDFLAEEVLDKQPEEVRLFLLRSSVLNVFSGSLCEAVVNPQAQPGYGAVMLDRLEHANLFIYSLDEKHEWFRYHSLFADFLRHIQSEINPDEISSLQKRAAEWFEQHADLDEAFRYALAAQDWAWAADLIERNIRVMIASGEIFALTHWIGKLPDAVIHQRPLLGLAYAWGLIAAYQLDKAAYWLEDVQLAFDRGADAPAAQAYSGESDPNRLWSIQGGLAICRSTLALLNGDAEKAAQYSREAVSFLQEENPFTRSMLSLEDSLYFILSGDTQKAIESLRETVQIARQANNLLVVIISTCQLAEMQAMQGRLSLALSTLQKARYMAVGLDGKELPLVGIVDIGLGEIRLEQNELTEAQSMLEKGCQLAQTLWSLSSLDGMVSLARLKQIQGDMEGSQAVIHEASHMALSTESSQWDDSFVSAMAVRLALQRGDLAAAAQWWQRGNFPDFGVELPLEKYPYYVFEYLQLTQVRFLLALGRDSGEERHAQRSLELLQALLLSAIRFKRTTTQIEILILKAIALFDFGNVEPATQILLEALVLGEPAGYQRIFVDAGQPIVGLLEHCLSAQSQSGSYLPTPAYLKLLLAAIRAECGSEPSAGPHAARKFAPATRQSEDNLPISLSAREMEVLTLIAEGKSNQEISAQLYLALNTVKRHAYNIYAKLGVKKRTQAVSKARQLGLIN